MQTRGRFFVSLFLTRFADQILLFIVPLVVFKVSGSVAWSGIAFFCETFPRYVSFPVCGVLCDRISPIKLIQVSQIFRSMLCVLGVAGYAAFGGLGWLIVISAGSGVLTTQGFMAREAMLPHVFPGVTYKKVLSYTQIADQLGTVVGPIVAAALLDICAWEFVVIAAGALFMLSDLACASWKKSITLELSAIGPKHVSWLGPYLVALRHIFSISGLLELILLAAGVNLVVGVTLATSAAIFTGIYGQSASHYAALQVVGAIATVIVLISVAHTNISARLSGFSSYVLIIIGGLLTGWIAGPDIYACGFILVIGFDKMFSVFIRGARQRLIPKEDFGKTVGLVVLLNNITQPLAGLLVSYFAKSLGTGNLIVILSGSMATIGLTVTAMRAKRSAWLTG
ncbi:MFS transporter [bacterium M00.F.Ca.ET.228.01.1.1]|nr:MFS transporter [Paraburkholderia phenoliruptrix]TGP48162.1 MFS transporter [bacterium M00.F.Ca.ET.228.01.1.1]TGS05954.1 MFS transporter [bacterium M00.F.Ca.ET.191.01.1.1]TGU10889.1 MFS transporter [bacterium M00.F.Ca.ET.155.01.1.1]MBW0445148.1 MFS transporter [Paraburkholderia phenoliruptrix]MBW9095913.1 MFS transporter [Paraburkholderia phenoliruptrix]